MRDLKPYGQLDPYGRPREERWSDSILSFQNSILPFPEKKVFTSKKELAETLKKRISENIDYHLENMCDYDERQILVNGSDLERWIECLVNKALIRHSENFIFGAIKTFQYTTFIKRQQVCIPPELGPIPSARERLQPQTTYTVKFYRFNSFNRHPKDLLRESLAFMSRKNALFLGEQGLIDLFSDIPDVFPEGYIFFSLDKANNISEVEMERMKSRELSERYKVLAVSKFLGPPSWSRNVFGGHFKSAIVLVNEDKNITPFL